MHFHLPKPLHGWREFMGEVGIIVIGILIALGGEQLVEDWRWHRDVRDFRAAVNSEVEFNLEAGDYRVRQSPCVERRLAELERWSAQLHSARPTPLVREIAYPWRIYPDVSVWNSRGADLPAHVPKEARLAYSDLYDLFLSQWKLVESERDTWLSLNGYNRTTRLGPSDLIRLDELIYRAKALDRQIADSQKDFDHDAGILRLRPSFGGWASQIVPPPADFCKPLLPAVSGKAA